MRTPDRAALEEAADFLASATWLLDGIEHTDYQRRLAGVADWLLERAAMQEANELVARIAKERGVSRSTVREAMRRANRKPPTTPAI